MKRRQVSTVPGPNRSTARAGVSNTLPRLRVNLPQARIVCQVLEKAPAGVPGERGFCHQVIKGA